MQGEYINKLYANIAHCDFENVLFEIKTMVSNISNLDENSRFKIEFILEELITNSFSHLNLAHSSVDIRVILFMEEFRIEYQEIGVEDLNFIQILKDGQEKNCNPSLDRVGGLGLSLVHQISKKLNYRYDKSKKTSSIEVLFS